MMYSKSPCGAVRLIVILPLASSVVMPEGLHVFGLDAHLSAPTMPPKKPTPGELILKSR